MARRFYEIPFLCSIEGKMTSKRYANSPIGSKRLFIEQ